MRQVKTHWGIIIIIIAAVLLVGGALFWYYYTQAAEDENQTAVSVPKNNSTNNSSQTNNEDIAEAKKIADIFMADQKTAGQDYLEKMFTLFTPPTTAKEKTEYDFLSGADSGGSARVAGGTAGFGYQILDYQLDNGTKQGDAVIFAVTETRKYANNATGTSTTKPGTTYLEMTKQDTGYYLVNKYYLKDYQETNSTNLKYSGFYLGLN